MVKFTLGEEIAFRRKAFAGRPVPGPDPEGATDTADPYRRYGWRPALRRS